MKKALEKRIKKVEKSSGNGAAVKMLEVPSGAVVLKFIFFALFRMKSLIHVYKYKKCLIQHILPPPCSLDNFPATFVESSRELKNTLFAGRKGEVASNKYTGMK